MDLGAENLGWFQSQFEQQVITIYRSQGFDFIPRLKATFPATEDRVPVAEALERLECISPGFLAWHTQTFTVRR